MLNNTQADSDYWHISYYMNWKKQDEQVVLFTFDN